MQTIDEITEYLKKNLTEKRFAHTMGVAKVAQSLAVKWGADSASAFLAGLVHDCAKEVAYDEMREGLLQNGYDLAELNMMSAALFHAPYGAILAKKFFGIEDKAVLNAVKYHTVGRPDMTLLEKIIYVADFIEPNRTYKEADVLRKLAFEDLDKAVFMEADMVINFNKGRDMSIHPDTIITRDYYLKLTKEENDNEA